MAIVNKSQITPGTRLRLFASWKGSKDPNGVYLRRMGNNGMKSGITCVPSVVLDHASCVIDRNVLAAYGDKHTDGALYAYLEGELAEFGNLAAEAAKKAKPIMFDPQEPAKAFKLVDGRVPIAGADTILFARSSGRTVLLAVNPRPL